MEKKKFNKKWLLLLLIPAFFGTMLTIRHFTGICPCKVVLNKIVSTITGKPCNTCEESKEKKKKVDKIQNVIEDGDIEVFNVSYEKNDKLDWTRGIFKLDDEVFTDSFTLNDMIKAGFEIKQTIDIHDVLRKDEVANYIISRDSTELQITVRNNTEKDLKPEDCDVYIISAVNTDKTLADGIKLNMSTSDVKGILGQASTEQGSATDTIWSYMSPSTGYNLTLTFADDKLFTYQYVINSTQALPNEAPPENVEESNEENKN